MIQEFSSEPIHLPLPQNADIIARLRMFLGHYDLRIYISGTAYIDVDRGSFDAFFHVEYVSNSFVGCLGTVGQFCDFAKCTLFGGGVHRNELPLNIVFASTPQFRSVASKYGLSDISVKDHIPFSIGNAVLLSADASVLGGAKVGDGAVIAANALVNGTVAPFTIHGGLPSRKIKARFDEATMAAIASVRWWDFETVYLGNNLDTIQTLATDTETKHVYRKPTPRFVLRLFNVGKPGQQVQILGFATEGKEFKVSDAPEHVRSYLGQLGVNSETYQWIANVWE